VVLPIHAVHPGAAAGDKYKPDEIVSMPPRANLWPDENRDTKSRADLKINLEFITVYFMILNVSLAFGSTGAIALLIASGRHKYGEGIMTP
jgi:hypothetical protein